MRHGRWAGALVLVLVLGSGCVAGKETRDGAKQLRADLGTPSWASSVDVSAGRDGQLADQVQVTVTARASARPEELTDFVVALPERAAEVGLDRSGLYQLELVWPSGARLRIDWQQEVDADEVARGVGDWWLAATANIDLDRYTVATLRSDGGASYVFDLAGAEVAGTQREQVFLVWTWLGPLVREDTAIQVTGAEGPMRLDFATAAYPTPEQVDLWTQLLNGFDLLPAELTPSLLTLHLLDRAVADAGLLAPPGTTEEEFTLDAWGARVWPAVRAQLRALQQLSGPWTYTTTEAPVDADYDGNLFISLLSDQVPVDNGDEATRWSRAAADYVAGL